MASRERPLSPHLQVYRLKYTMVLSITHRITGVALSGALLLLVAWLLAAAGGASVYAAVTACLAHPLARTVMGLAVLAFWYHLFAGLRHLAWDAGYGFEKPAARASGRLIVILALLSTLATLALAWRHFGGAA